MNKKEAASSLLGAIFIFIVFVYVDATAPFAISFASFGKVAPVSIAEWLEAHFGNSLYALKEFTKIVLAELEAVLVAGLFVYHCVLNRGKKYDVFLSIPMKSFANDDEYLEHKRLVEDVIQQVLKKRANLRIYNPADGFLDRDSMERSMVSIKKDIAALKRSKNFVLILPRALNSSVIFEAGVAFDRGMHSLYMVKTREDLPYIIREAEIASEFIHIMSYSDRDDIASIMENFAFK